MLGLITVDYSCNNLRVEIIEDETQIQVLNRLVPETEGKSIDDLHSFEIDVFENETYGKLFQIFTDKGILYCFVEILDEALEFYFDFYKEQLIFSGLVFDEATKKFEDFVLREMRFAECPDIKIETMNVKRDLDLMTRFAESGTSFAVQLAVEDLPFSHNIEDLQ